MLTDNPGYAWGIWDDGDQKDVLGTLNLLTPEVVRAAYSECKDGISVSLNWPLGAIKTPGFGRKGLVHKVTSFIGTPVDAHGYDDELEFNTQCSSQWDSLCHFHHQPSAAAYNGIRTNVEELTQPFGTEDWQGKLPTLQHWHARGGLVARGVLIDYKSWAEKRGIEYSPFSAHQITVSDIEQIAKDQGVEFRLGDMIIIRSGFTEELTGIADAEQRQRMSSGKTCGVSGTPETAAWFWDRHFSAVAGDMISFEQTPPQINGKDAHINQLVLHQYFLGLFGLPIGELWDLKILSETCYRLGRYSFLLTSVPLNVSGSVGSPANALALF